jgi:hypothetical protein
MLEAQQRNSAIMALVEAVMLLVTLAAIYTPFLLIVLAILGKVEWEVTIIVILSLIIVFLSTLLTVVRGDNDDLVRRTSPLQ